MGVVEGGKAERKARREQLRRVERIVWELMGGDGVINQWGVGRKGARSWEDGGREERESVRNG